MPAAENRPTGCRVEIISAVFHQIAHNYREASLAEIAEAYGVSLAYVSECVRVGTGQTYKSLLQKKRMEVAARLLRHSDLRVHQIIRHVGYENTSYFYHLFSERYGQTPQEYRRDYLTRH